MTGRRARGGGPAFAGTARRVVDSARAVPTGTNHAMHPRTHPTTRGLAASLLAGLAALASSSCVQRVVDAPGATGCDPPCLAEQGWAGYESGQWDKWVLFASAINMDSSFAEGHLGLGWFNIEFGWIDVASLNFQAAIAFDTSLVAAYAGNAFCLATSIQGGPPPDYEGAITMAEAAILRGGPDWVFEHNDAVSARSLHLLLAGIYFNLRNYPAAQAEIDQIEPGNQLNPSSRSYISDLLLYIASLGGQA